MCRKNKKWQPPRAIGPIEDCLKEFEEIINKETGRRKHLKGSYLANLQQKGLNYLINNKQCVRLIEDKNKGPCIANRNDCIAAILKQHFQNHNVCERMSEEQAQEFMNEATRMLHKSITKFSKDKKKKAICYAISKQEANHIVRSATLDTITLVACGMSNSHKGKRNPPLYAPVVAVVNT